MFKGKYRVWYIDVYEYDHVCFWIDSMLCEDRKKIGNADISIMSSIYVSTI